ncbi:MAG: biotin attachment protein [Spirochaetales bacterium]|uniref:biotin/lipoyl-containing protein n=1 Tax=Bullifex sp. TaxID=2815808 RepID=UPI002A566F66|nr:biotin/lipoyl-containing protein [Bullifex sp.]MDD7272172.1 biotin attachment protein [Spirochaetales bacterium]MDY4067687.1 biotin/lipoyl-containing protein [Bullifex sp.]
MAKKKINFMCTAFRDGFQSVYGARVFTKDFMPAVAAAREAGITHFEAGGGARFQALYFYTNEDAFKMMDEFREVAGPDANLQTLSRGVNVVGLDSQPRDIIKLHAQMFKKHGMTTIRNFDALNDVNNLIDSGRAIHEAGLKHEVTVTMMSLPDSYHAAAHNPEFYEKILRQILDAGIPFDSLCFKDASGTSTPHNVYETIKRARKLLGPNVNIVFHSHETAGVSIQQYMSAIEAGATQVDLSMSPCSGGTCQPDILTMWHALRGTDYDLGIDVNKVQEAERVFENCMKDYFLPPEATKVNPNIPFFPLPGGALTANTQMLRDNNLMDKYPEIVEAMGDVVKKGGFGTSVTPVSQFYFQQAFNNVMFGPWKKIAEGYGKMVLGYFGKTPVEPDQEVVKAAAEQLKLEPTTEKVVDLNDKNPNKGREAAIKMLKEANLEESEENIFIAASCKEKGILYLTGKAKVNGVRKVEKEAPKSAPAAKKNTSGEYTVTVNGTAYGVKLDGANAIVNGVSYPLSIADGLKVAAAPAAAQVVVTGSQDVTAPMPGLILKMNVKVGDEVKKNQEIAVMEAMKMENPIYAPCDGKITAIKANQGDQLQAGDVILSIGGTQVVQAAPAPAAAPVAAPVAAPAGGTEVKAPMPGLILKLNVKKGDQVKKNDEIAVMEAMKMENPIYAPCDGVVSDISVNQGDQLQADDTIMVIA